MRVKIIVDSTVDLPAAQKAQVTAVPLAVRFADQEYLDGVTITAEAFYEKLEQAQELPTTSQPTPASFEDAFREAVEAGYEVVCITIASGLSGTYQSATIAAEEFPGKVWVVDSRSAALGAGILTEYALELAEQGLGGEEILQALIRKRKQIRLYFIVDTLEYLKKGGRLSGAVAVVGGLLNIKPVLTVEEGGIRVLGTARGMKKAYAMLDQACIDSGVDRSCPVLLGHTGGSDEHLRKYVAEGTTLWHDGDASTIIGAAIGVHVGPGAVAACFFAEE
ncbi:MAG: DegV family protein [Oscillospiraceae bacterium]|nr:DegV family protein [Oscillospiraceae bacterium]